MTAMSKRQNCVYKTNVSQLKKEFMESKRNLLNERIKQKKFTE